MSFILARLSSFIITFRSNFIPIIMVMSILVFSLWLKVFHFDKINSLIYKVNKYENMTVEYKAIISSMESDILKEKDKCSNRILEIKQGLIKKDLESSIKELDNENNFDIKTSVGSHTIVFPK